MNVRSAAVVVAISTCLHCAGQHAADGLAANTVLIVRHAEKPEAGPSLTALGAARAQQYATYFEPFHSGVFHFRVDALYAGSDSANSERPRLTLEPISKATGLPLNLEVGTKESEKLVTLLRTQPHGSHPLIAWRHGQMRALLLALGADPAQLLPDGKWPDAVFDWVILLQFDEAGKLTHQERLKEDLAVTAP